MSTRQVNLTRRGDGRISISEISGISISFTGSNLAELFWQLEAKQQSAFFEKLGEIKKSEGYLFDMQMLSLREHLGECARTTLRELADGVWSWDECK